MLKKYFDWTPRDVAQWETIRKKGVLRFTLWYGLISGGIIFVIPGVWALIDWFMDLVAGRQATNGLSFLALKLLMIAVVGVLAGIVNALATWVMEEKIYQQKYVQHKEN